MVARHATPRRVLAVTLASLALLLATLVGSLLLGVEHASLTRALADRESLDAAILFGARAPRVLLGALVGGALAAAGVAFQALLRNPLGDPYVLGVSGGAAAAATAAALFGGAGALGVWTRPVWAFVGALVAVGLVFTFGRVQGRLVPHVALLAGVIVNALAGAIVLGLRALMSPQALAEAVGWLSGVLGAVDGTRLVVLTSYVFFGLVVLALSAVDLNALALGEEAARTIGVDVDRARRRVFLAGALMTAAAVAFAGPIGFVGIVVPHALRRLVGADHRLLLPAALFGGAAFLVGADTAARLAFLAVGSEPTVGVLTALIGAPLFLVILRRRGLEQAL